MAISGISSAGNYAQQTAVSKYYHQASSGNRINSAADDAAGLAISEKLETARTIYDVGADNAAAGKDLINVADGALSTITDSLQRIRELSLQAANSAIYTPTDVSAMQDEISQLKDQIASTANTAQFNTKHLLDGTEGEFNIATNQDGSGTTLHMPTTLLSSLGIEDYDVTGSFNIGDIDKAIAKVSEGRSGLGAASNVLDHTIGFNKLASYNHSAAKSRIKDTEYGQTISDLKKTQVLEQFRLRMQKNKEDENGRVLQLFKY
ncbi:flagellin [Lachnospiraceae bacterium ZAX-1]